MTGKPLKLNGVWSCVNCHASMGAKGGRPRLRCDDCRQLHNLWRVWLSGCQTAAAYVATAIKRGHIPHPTACACMDCGKRADAYDHRDYGHPLDVKPVCYGCNFRRGPAKPLNPFLVAGLLLANAQSLADVRESHGTQFFPA